MVDNWYRIIILILNLNNTDVSEQYRRKVGSSNSNNANKRCLMKQINNMKSKLDESHCIIFVHKSKVTHPSHRYYTDNYYSLYFSHMNILL